MKRTLLFFCFAVIIFQYSSSQVRSAELRPFDPITSIDAGDKSVPALVDIDDDGDLDLFAGNQGGTIIHYRYSSISQTYTERTGSNNPLNGVTTDGWTHPSFADLDNDGDFDVVIGRLDGDFLYFKNTGSVTVPVFTQKFFGDNPFNDFFVNSISSPVLVDFDGDGDFDMFSGAQDGTIRYFRNNGSVSSPLYGEQTGSVTLNGVDVGSYSQPALADCDDDGDLDLIVGKFEGSGSYVPFHYFVNTGSISSANFVLQPFSSNPFNDLRVDPGNTRPQAVDFDGDDFPDIVSGNWDGTFSVFEICGPLPQDGFLVLGRSTPTFVDIDGDGDKDLFSGEYEGSFKYYKNRGTASSPLFYSITGSSNPLNGKDVGECSAPAFADLNGDGDFDMVSGNESTLSLYYFENTGTVSNPQFTQRFGGSNPFNGVEVGANSIVTFVDLDNDGDKDLVAGNNVGGFQYLINIGSPSSPSFTDEWTDEDNSPPFPLIDAGNSSAPVFIDVDADGDFDLFSGNEEGDFRFFRNTGTASLASFTEETGSNNPLNGVSTWFNSTPAIVDLYDDDVPRLFSGNADGYFSYHGSVPITSLPVELVSFTATAARSSAELQWSTATEVNNYGFEVERKGLNHRIIGSLNQSTDEPMDQWKAVSFIEGHGNTNAPSEYAFTDQNLSAGKYSYRLKQVDRDGSFTYSQEVKVSVGTVPNVFALEQNYPNPFNPSTMIGFTLQVAGMTTLKIYDAVGREVSTLVNEDLEAGVYHQRSFDASRLSSGLYLARLVSGGNMQVRKIMLMK